MTDDEVYQELARDRESLTAWWHHKLETQRRRVVKCSRFPMKLWLHVVFLAFVQNVADVHEFFDGRKNVASYPNAEKSYELAIKYCLENLI